MLIVVAARKQLSVQLQGAILPNVMAPTAVFRISLDRELLLKGKYD
jgi:hypothetical protein